MMILSDHDVEGQAEILFGILAAESWAELMGLRLVRFSEVNLPTDATDRAVWRFAQANGMILVTANRQMEEASSLEAAIREENTSQSLPVVTIADKDRIQEKSYRLRCANRLLEILVDIDAVRGAGRLFIP